MHFTIRIRVTLVELLELIIELSDAGFELVPLLWSVDVTRPDEEVGLRHFLGSRLLRPHVGDHLGPCVGDDRPRVWLQIGVAGTSELRGHSCEKRDQKMFDRHGGCELALRVIDPLTTRETTAADLVSLS